MTDKRSRSFLVNGTKVDVPEEELEDFQNEAVAHNATPDELHSFRVTTADGKGQDVTVAESERADFESEAARRGATFEPLRTLVMDDGTERTMPAKDISSFLRSREYRESEDYKKRKAAADAEMGSPALAALTGALGGFFSGAWAGGNAVANKMVKALPELGIEVENAAGHVARAAGKGLKALGANDLGESVESTGEGIVNSAAEAKAWLDAKLPSETKDWQGYEDWSAKLSDWIGNASAMAVKFAPGMAKEGVSAFMNTVFATDGANAAANAYDEAKKNGLSTEEAAAVGSTAFLVNYFGGKLVTKAGGIAEGVENPILKFLAGGAASGHAMGLQNVGNKGVENVTKGRPITEGMGEAYIEGQVEGMAFHAYNALPGFIGQMRAGAEARHTSEETARREILEMIKSDDGRATLAMLAGSEELDAAIRARKSGERVTREMAIAARLPETMTPTEVNQVLDAVANQRTAQAERNRTGMDDVQAAALAETVKSLAGEGEIMERTWLKAVEKITDARDLDDPDIRERLVAKAAKEAAAEIEGERRAVLDEQSRIRGLDVRGQLDEMDKRGVMTWEDAEADGLIRKDEQGRWTGGARQAVNIAVNGTETLKTAVKDGAISGDLAEEMITLSHCELGWMPKEARDAIIDKVLDAAGGNAEMAQRMMEIVGRCDRAELADVDARVRRVADQVAEGLAETARTKAGNPEGREPQTAYEGAVNAERMKGTELRSIDGGVMACEKFPEVTVEIDQDGIHVRGMTDALMSKPENVADAAALLSRLEGIAKQNGQMVDFGGDKNAETVARGIIDEVERGGLKRTQRMLETRSRLFEVLMESQLGNGVSYDEASFAAALGKLENGRKFRDNHGNIYGLKDADGVLHFNPTALDLNIPIHEYGHLALEALRKVNPTLLKRGMDLIAGSDYYGEIRRNSETEGHEYSYLKGKEEWLRDEALATMIGDRGQRLVEQKGLGAELKAWMKEFWKTLKGAFGVADLTDEQIEKMSLGEFVDAVNAELLRGKEFGTRKQRPLEKRSITRYDEDQGSGANGMLRWRNDRGYLFALPVDMERTRPGGKVVLARDDANITDWIQSRLNGVELRMSKNGKIYVKGANGLEGELAEIFGRYPTIGKNDGIFDAIAAELPAVGASGATPEALVEALRKDRANYDAWAAATHDGKTLEALREEQRAADEAEREEFEARERYERSGMNALDYVRSRIDEGEPGFDLDWETMREIAREAEQGKFAVGKAPNGKPSNLDERQQAEVRTPEFKRFFGNWENAAKGAAIKSQKPVVVTARPKGVSVRDAYSRLADGENVYDRRKVRFVMSTLGKILRHKGYPAERIVHQLKDIYDTAVPIGFQEEQAREGHKKHPNFVGYHNYVGKIADGGREYYVRITVQEERTRSKTYNPNAVHSTFVSDVELYKESDLLALNTANSAGKVGAVANDRGALSRSTTSVGERERGPITDKILANFLAEGKGASKIVDENGEPMVVYHATNNDEATSVWDERTKQYLTSHKPFTIFKRKVDGLRNNGHFFTSDRSNAEGYGNTTYACYLNIRNPLVIDCNGSDYSAIKHDGRVLDTYEWAQWAEKNGHDGVIFKNVRDGVDYGAMQKPSDEYVVFSSNQIKSATDNAGTFDPGNPDVRFMVGSGRKLDSSVFIAGRARVADDAGVGEQTPGALAASRELATQGATPISLMGQFRKMSLPMSEIEHLRRLATGDRLPVHVARRMPGGRAAAHTKAGQLFIAADVFGTVDKTDMEHEKAFLRQHGFFMNEDANWCSNQTGAAIRAEQRRSEEQLATRLLHLGSRRVRGVEPGGQEAGRRVLADEVAKIVMDLPQQLGGTLGRVQTIGKGVRDDIRRRLNGSNDQAKREAGDFLDWAYGSGIVDPATGNTVARADAMALDELTSSMFGAWLVMPHEVEMRAPNWDAAFVSAIAGDQRLATAWRELSVRAFTERSHSHVEAKIRQQLERGTQAALMKLQQEADSPISAGSRMADLKETMLVGFHDKFAPVYVRVDEKLKDFIKAKKAAIRTATSALDRQMLRAEIDRFGGQMAAKLHKLELSRTASERGAWNEGRRYWLEMARLENDATRWGLTEEDKSLYLELKRVVETQGRAASFMQDARQAQMSLDDMKRRLGAAGFARLEDYTRRFHAIIEREIYDDARLERALGKGLVDYFRSQSDYVTTKRTWSKDELDAIETARADARAAGVAGGDDVVSGMYRYAGARGAGDVVGLSASEWTAVLKGSAAARQESRSATWAKQSGLMQFARRNQMVLDLRDVLLSAGVEGVRELSATEGGSFPKGNRYGHIAFMENGQKKMLVVPTQIAEAFKTDPDRARWLTVVNGLVRTGLIDYNLAYGPMNVRRNQASLELNMEGMRETYLKTALRAIAPGVGSTADLALQALVRKVPVVSCLFGKHTVYAHIPKALRYVRILEDLSGWQKELWEAENAHDAAKVTRMYDDYAGVMEMLKGNMFIPTSSAYAGGDASKGFAFDAMNRKGLKTVAQIEEESRGDGRWSKFCRAVNVFKKNQAWQEHEEMLAKTIGYLHDRMFYESSRTVQESGLAVKRNVSIAEGERKGRYARTIQHGMAQFFNMVEKGVVRHWRNFKERPGEMAAKDAKVWIGRAMGMMLANGTIRAWLLADCDGDEEKARKKYGHVYNYAKAYQTAYKNCSSYVKENYNFTPLWNSADGMTSVVLGGALTDEDKLIVPTADFIAGMIAHKMGVAPKPELGKTLANSTFKAVTPDLALSSPIMNFLRSTVEATFVDNPTDFFRNAPMYDQTLWEIRNESWEMRGKFAAAMGAKLWSDMGGRALLPAGVNGVDNGRGSAPQTLEIALRSMPVVSPVIGRMLKIQVGSPNRHGEAIVAEDKRRRAIIDQCAKDLMKRVDISGVDFYERDPEAYEKQLQTWKDRYGLNDFDVQKLRVKYLNGTIQRKNRMGYDQREMGKLRKKAREIGMTDEEIWLQLGDM